MISFLLNKYFFNLFKSNPKTSLGAEPTELSKSPLYRSAQPSPRQVVADFGRGELAQSAVRFEAVDYSLEAMRKAVGGEVKRVENVEKHGKNARKTLSLKKKP